MTDLRAITIRQPWAAAVACGAKTVENRKRGFPTWYRGPLLIHAGAGWSKRGASDPRVVELAYERGWSVEQVDDDPTRVLAQQPALRRKSALAVADLVDVHHAEEGCCDTPWAEYVYTGSDGVVVESVSHLVLADTVALPEPVECIGRLGLWNPDPLLIAMVQLQCATLGV